MATRFDLDDRRAGIAAMATSAAMLAHQVGGRAMRDALFLSQFPVTTLSGLMVVSALISAAAALPWARLLLKHGPERLLPRAFATSAVSLAGIWGLSLVAPRPAAIALYLQIVILGPVIVSGFWLLFTERFDARAAKRLIGPLGAVGTLGGVAGGLLSSGVSQWAGPNAMLLVLAGIHLLCVPLVRGVSHGAESLRRSHPTDADQGDLLAGVRAIVARPYLRHVGVVVALSAAGAALLEYVLKAEAGAAGLDARALVRLFAFFHSGVAVLTFLVQVRASRGVLKTFGPARTLATAPLSVFVGGTLAALVPGLPSMLAARSAEMVLRNSLFRSGYQVLFTPIPAGERRSTKSIIDIALERIGEAAGGGLTALLVLVAGQSALGVMLWTAAAIGFAGTMLALRLHREYLSTLEQNLAEDASPIPYPMGPDVFVVDPLKPLPPDPAEGPPTPVTPADINAPPVASALLPLSDGVPTPAPRPARQPPATPADLLVTMAIDRAVLGLGPGVPPPPELVQAPATLMERTEALLSGDVARIRAALAPPLPISLVPHVIPMTGRDEVAGPAVRALLEVAPAVIGQLTDALLDADLGIDARRRVARVVGRVGTPRAIEGLTAGLDDPRFAVRHACGLALVRIRERSPETRFDPDRVFTHVYREVDVESSVWLGNRDLMRLDEHSPFDAFLERRASASLEHVFHLLALALPPQPLLAAWRRLDGADRTQRGLALDYLESVLPGPIRDRLWPFLEEDPNKPPSQRSVSEIVKELQQHDSIRIKMSDLQKPE